MNVYTSTTQPNSCVLAVTSVCHHVSTTGTRRCAKCVQHHTHALSLRGSPKLPTHFTCSNMLWPNANANADAGLLPAAAGAVAVAVAVGDTYGRRLCVGSAAASTRSALAVA
jgi:hypothetical protein